MQRVSPSPDTLQFSGLAELHEQGLPERIWIVNQGVTRELFLDFAEMSGSFTPENVDGIDEPVLVLGKLCSWMRLAGLTPAGRPIVIGTETGSIWLLAEERILINWSPSSLEACYERRSRFREVEGTNDFDLCAAALPALVDDLVQIEPRMAIPYEESIY